MGFRLIPTTVAAQLTGQGLFVYGASPPGGNLVISIAPTAGKDPYGNSYSKGLQILGKLLAALVGTAAADTMLTATVAGDTGARFNVNADGTHSWGSGAAPADTNLYRAAAALLQTDDSLGIGKTLTFGGDVLTDLYRAAAGLLQTDGSLSVQGSKLAIGTTSGKLYVTEGTNASMGTAVLAAGTATVATTTVTANSRILLAAQVTSGSPGALGVSARTPGTSFTITSTSATDTSTVAWLVVEPD